MQIAKMETIKNIIESLLFVSESPLTMDRMKKMLGVDTKEIREALRTLSEEYEARRGGFHLCEVAGGYQLRTRPEYKEWIVRFMEPRPVRLSKAAMETLVIVAYNQPAIRSEIERIRGVDCGGVIHTLLERKLVRILGRKEIPGRPLIYATTKEFLELFELKDLKDLPSPREVESLAKSSSIGDLSESAEGVIPKDSGEDRLSIPEAQPLRETDPEFPEKEGIVPSEPTDPQSSESEGMTGSEPTEAAVEITPEPLETKEVSRTEVGKK